MKLKYITGYSSLRDNGSYDEETGIIFPFDMVHQTVASRLRFVVTGAGFFYIEEGKVVCYGRSESLDVDSRPVEDAAILSQILGL